MFSLHRGLKGIHSPTSTPFVQFSSNIEFIKLRKIHEGIWESKKFKEKIIDIQVGGGFVVHLNINLNIK